jgi:hypothetical protein
MQLLAIDGFVDVALDPRVRHRSQTHLFHAAYDAGNSAMPSDEVLDGAGEFLARQLTPKLLRYAYPSLHDIVRQSEPGISLAKRREKNGK